MAAVSAKSVALLAAVLLVLVASAAATARTVEREEVVSLGSLAPSLAPAPAPTMLSAASALAPGAWAVAALVSLLAFLGH
ncbi:uncharacterized protein LOC124662427 [Lolium rigidum]|uniref:uncharacterized protein LOC124662427 n=1 Tax=Lolium rigidum TaxID=89674 RepID=UPI001F5C2294|nr:uncharacterized protein LOC124662427 [Lolium rigidum]